MATMLLDVGGISWREIEELVPILKRELRNDTEVPADLDIASGEVKGPPPVVNCWTSNGNEELVKEYLNVNDTVGRVDVRLANEDDDKAKRKRKLRSDKGKSRTPKLVDPNDPNPIKTITTEGGVVVGHFDKSTGEVSGAIVRDPMLAANIKTVGGQTNEIDLNAVREKLAAIKERQAAREEADRQVAAKNADQVDPREAVVNVKTETVEMEGSIDEALTAIDPTKPKGELITDEQVARLRELRVEAAKLNVFAEFRKIIVDDFGNAGKFPEIPRATADRILPKIQELLAAAEEGAKVDE